MFVEGAVAVGVREWCSCSEYGVVILGRLWACSVAEVFVGTVRAMVVFIFGMSVSKQSEVD